jgi:hypothetical protein
MTCLVCKHRDAKRFGFYGRKRIQRYRAPAVMPRFLSLENGPPDYTWSISEIVGLLERQNGEKAA